MVKAEVLANDGKTVKLKVVETLAGAEVPEKANDRWFQPPSSG